MGKKSRKYGFQVENIEHSDIIAHVHKHGTYMHLSEEYETSRPNGLVTIDINEGKKTKIDAKVGL